MTASQLAGIAAVLGALGTLVGTITALIVALHAHGRIDKIQQGPPPGPPTPPPGPRP